jgi:hypothetical protein
MIRQSASKEPTPSAAYTTLNGVIWVIYVALVLLVPPVFAFADPLIVTASVLIAALVLLHPLRRRASRAAMRRFNHR